MNPQPDFLKQPPAPLPSRPIVLPSVATTTLPNGLVVILVEDTRLPLVSYRLALRTGDAHDPAELPGLMDMLTGLLTEGTESRTSREIADEVARLGATLQAGANSDYTTVAASSLATFSNNILELMADVALRPVFPANEVELTKQNTKESLKQQRAQPSFLAGEMVARVMFGQHPYHVTSPTPESVDATTRERLIEFHRATFVANNAVLIIAGDVEPHSILQQVENLFGKWQPGTVLSDDFPQPPARTSRSAYVVDRPGSAQANIVISNTGLTRTSPDYFPLLVMHTVLGANASSRLFMNLREEKGYTYGAYSSLDARRTAGTFRATAEVRTPVTGDSLKEFFYELNRIRNEPVSEKEIADAKSYLTGVFPIRLETQEGLIDQLVQTRMFGLPENYLEIYRGRIQAVTIAEVQEVAQKYVRPDEAAIVVVGDAAQLVEQMKPYVDEIEFYSTSGKKKDKPAAVALTPEQAAALTGNWSLKIDTPLGQAIPATLILANTARGISGKVESEMGNGELLSVAFDGESFSGTISFDISGHPMEAQIEGEVADERMEGSISLQNADALPFAGSRNS
ncbi:MAG TPA: pitrilysin family protein [Pyrinomonadaceae bacterium]|jgi:zinc protease|nr:pitrilysin family protein [Pyrinomonadaceae bacterium]